MRRVIRVAALPLMIAVVPAGNFAKAKLPIEKAPAEASAVVNPFAGQERARKAGEKLFRRECAECHGLNAGGQRKIPPLNVLMITNAAPGKIFWVLRNGSLYRGMPSFAALPEQQRWQIVTYLQSLTDKH